MKVNYIYSLCTFTREPMLTALIAQLGERKTEDLEALCSIHSQSIGFLHLSQASLWLFLMLLIDGTKNERKWLSYLEIMNVYDAFHFEFICSMMGSIPVHLLPCWKNIVFLLLGCIICIHILLFVWKFARTPSLMKIQF